MKLALSGIVMLFAAAAILAGNNSLPALAPADPTPDPGLTLEYLGDYVAPSWVQPAPAAGAAPAQPAPGGWAAQLQPAAGGHTTHPQSMAPEPVGWYEAPGIPGPGDNEWRDPYPNYIVTQGPHGLAYGHYAVDLTAGKGAEILSPIHGTVTAVYVDQYNNSVVVIENSRYQVLMMHGNYTVTVGQVLRIGDKVGTEWNNGYTIDGNGNLCAGRDCGYHTHLNIFDRSLNSNIDPFTLLAH